MYRCHHDEETIAKALHGQWREEHLLALAQAVALYDMYHQKIAECDRQIEAHLGTFAERQDLRQCCRWCGRGSGHAIDRVGRARLTASDHGGRLDRH